MTPELLTCRSPFVSFKFFILRSYCVSSCVLAIVLSLPVALTAYPPLVDYPNHLARAYIEYRYSFTPSFQALYERVSTPVPNSATDLLIPLLLPYVLPTAAGRIFLVVTVVLFVLGCHMLGRSLHDRPTPSALLCTFLVYNSALLYGFLNYVFGVALYTVVLAFWLRHRQEWTLPPFILVVALAFALYAAHLSAYAFLAVSIIVVTILDSAKHHLCLRGALLNLSPLAPPAAAFLFLAPTHRHATLEWHGVSAKLVGLLGLVRSYDARLDFAVGVIWAVFALWILTHLNRVRVSRSAVLIGSMFVMAWILSPSVVGLWSPVDARFVLPAALLLILSVDVLSWNRLGRTLFACVLVASLLRVGYVWATWTTLDHKIADAVDMLAALPDGVTVYPAFFPPSGIDRQKRDRSFEHVIHYATISRNAHLPTLLAVRGYFTLAFREEPRYHGPAPDLRAEDLEGYDCVWTYHAPATAEALLAANGTLLAEHDGFAIWRLSKPSRTVP